MAGGNTLEFTDGNFQQEVVDYAGVVLVDFWAPWCQPCLMLGPTIEELANDFAGRAKVGKLNTEDNPQVPTNLGVSAIPTVMIFKNGNLVDRFVGITPKIRMANKLDEQLK